jgi:glycosyltransferase involved in cell wall biosynthesis
MPLNVCHVVRSCVPQAGTVAIALRDMMAPLRDGGVQSRIVTAEPAADAFGATPIAEHGTVEARQAIERADVVHCHGYDPNLTPVIAKEAKRARVPYVLAPLGDLNPNPYTNTSLGDRVRSWTTDRSTLRNAAAFFALCEEEAAFLRQRAPGVPVELATYDVADGGDSEPVGRDPKYFLYLGPIDPIEGIVLLLRTIAELESEFSGWHLVLAGTDTGHWSDEIEAAVRRKGGHDRVTLVRNPDVATQRGWLARASLLVSPSLRIRVPVAILQGLAAGVPVLASEVGLTPQISALVRTFRPSKSTLRETMTELLQMPDNDRAEVARSAGAASRSLCGAAACADRLRAYYDRVVRKTPR